MPRRRPLRTLGRGLRAVVRTGAAQPMIGLAVVTAIALAITWPTISVTHEVSASVQPVLAVMSVAPLLLLRRTPFVGWAVSIVGCLVWWLVPRLDGAPMPWPVTHFLVLLLTIAVASALAPLRRVPVVLAGSAVVFLVLLPGEMKAWALGAAIIVAFGLLVRWLVLSRRQLARQEEDAEVERARRAVVEERSRIARELHDVVAHHMSMVVVQAQSAPYRVDDVSPAAREEFSAIESSARQALNEVRGVLGVLRQEDEGPPETAPQPGVADLPTLLESSRAAGMDLTWDLELGEGRCPPGTGLVLHRVLQEALANASRHAPGAAVEVILVEQGDHADLDVRSAKGSGLPSSPGTGGGNGIPGMRARAEAVGGHLHAGASADGGFVVRAVVPLAGRPGMSA